MTNTPVVGRKRIYVFGNPLLVVQIPSLHELGIYKNMRDNGTAGGIEKVYPSNA